MKVLAFVFACLVACALAHGHHGHGRHHGDGHRGSHHHPEGSEEHNMGVSAGNGHEQAQIIQIAEQQIDHGNGVTETFGVMIIASTPAHVNQCRGECHFRWPEHVDAAFCDQLEHGPRRMECMRVVIARMEADLVQIVDVMEAMNDNSIMMEMQMIGLYIMALLVCITAIVKICRHRRRRAMRQLRKAEKELKEHSAPYVIL